MAVCRTSFDLDKIFHADRDVTMGIEVEGYLVTKNDFDVYELNDDEELLESIYEEFDRRVYRDYYPYQLEIRTTPHNDPKDVIDELWTLMKDVAVKAREYGVKIIYASKCLNGMYNGMHVHFTSKEVKTPIQMTMWGLSAYPFVLLTNRITLSAPNTLLDLFSERLEKSPHIGLRYNIRDPERLAREFMEGGSARYHDFALNVNTSEGRKRIKDVATMEFRLFDVVGEYTALKAIIFAVYEIMRRIDLGFYVDLVETYGGKGLYERLLASRTIIAKRVPAVETVTGLTLQDLAEVVEPLRRYEGTTEGIPWYEIYIEGNDPLSVEYPI